MAALKFEMGMWGENGPKSLNYDFHDLYFSATGSPEFHTGFSTGGTLYASASAYAGINYDLGFGLVGLAKLNLGDVDGSFKMNANAVTSEANTAYATGAFVDTSGFEVLKSNMNITSFDIEKSSINVDLEARLKADLYGGYNWEAGVDIPAVRVHNPAWNDFFQIGPEYIELTPAISGEINGGDSFYTNLIDLNAQVNILNLSGKDLAQGFSRDFVYGVVTANLPKMTYGAAEFIPQSSGLNAIHISGTSNAFLTASLDLDAAVVSAFGLPPQILSGQFGLDTEYAKALVKYGLIDAKLTASATLEQDFLFTPDVDVTMKSSLGETVSGKLGDELHFQSPEGQGSFQVTATYDIDATLTASTYLRLASSFDYKILFGNIEASVNANVLGYDIGGSWASDPFALAQGSAPLGGGVRFDLFSDTSEYDLGTITEKYTVHYENFVTAASGENLVMTTHQTSVTAGDIDNTVTGNPLDNQIFGMSGRDVIRGSGGNDYIDGGKKNDILYGGSGNDTVYGGTGTDKLYGLLGTDVFVIADVMPNQFDVIMDFHRKERDIIDLTRIDANALELGDQAFHYIEKNNFSHTAGELRSSIKGSQTQVFGDIDGDGWTDVKFYLAGKFELIDADFIL